MTREIFIWLFRTMLTVGVVGVWTMAVFMATEKGRGRIWGLLVPVMLSAYALVGVSVAGLVPLWAGLGYAATVAITIALAMFPSLRSAIAAQFTPEKNHARLLYVPTYRRWYEREQAEIERQHAEASAERERRQAAKRKAEEIERAQQRAKKLAEWAMLKERSMTVPGPYGLGSYILDGMTHIVPGSPAEARIRAVDAEREAREAHAAERAREAQKAAQKLKEQEEREEAARKTAGAIRELAHIAVTAPALGKVKGDKGGLGDF